MEFERHYNSDIDDYANRVYAKHFPESIQLGDITKIKAEDLPDGEWIVSGGFPCQPFSSASRGRITAVDLWPEMLRIIKELKPEYIIAENVKEKPIRMAQDDSRQCGYKTSVYNIGAHEVGADHKRSRWWLVAYSNHKSELSLSLDAKMAELSGMGKTLWTWENYSRTIRISNGVSDRMDRLKCLGNAVVPQIAELLFNKIKGLI